MCVCVWSNFVELDAILKKAFKKDHLYENLPSLPPKKSVLLVDHSGDAFIAGRKEALQHYLEKLASLPRVQDHPEFLVWLGGTDMRATLK